MIVFWVVLSGAGIATLLYAYNQLTAKEFTAKAKIIGKTHRPRVKDYMQYGAEGGSSFLYDQLSRDHYYVFLEMENGKKSVLQLPRVIHERTSEDSVVNVRCAKGRLWGTWVKGLA